MRRYGDLECGLTHGGRLRAIALIAAIVVSLCWAEDKTKAPEAASEGGAVGRSAATAGPAKGVSPPARRSPRSSALKTVQLPEPKAASGLSLEQVLMKQQAVPLPGAQRLRYTEIGQLAWAAQGTLRPAAGAVSPDEAYPIKLYFFIPEGIYLYNPGDHTLQQTSSNDARGELAGLVGAQQAGFVPACGVLIAGSLRGTSPQYGNDARKLMQMQAGQALQNMLLQALSMGLGLVAASDVEATGVRRVCRLARTLDPLCVVFVGYPAGQEPPAAQVETTGTATKKVLFVVPRSFRDEELFETKRGLELAAVGTVIAGTRAGPIMGMLGGRADATVGLSQVKVDDYDAVVFVGGTGALDFVNNPGAVSIVRAAATKGKVLAAISIAPAILANAGVLRGVRVTGFMAQRGELMQAGAIYTGAMVERDGPIITATDPAAVPLFVRAILDAITGR